MCTRSISTVNVSPSTSTSTCPSKHSGSSYCEVWKSFVMSG